MPSSLIRAAQVKKIILCYEDQLPANWLVALGKLRGKLERAGVEVGGSYLLLRRQRAPASERAREKQIGADLQVAPLHALPSDADIILAPQPLCFKAQLAAPNAWVVALTRTHMSSALDKVVAQVAGWAPVN